jgi:hypothetical protein
MASQFVNRVVSYVANEIVIKGLANSRVFQRFAVTADHHLNEIKKTTDQALNEISKSSTDQISAVLEKVAAQQTTAAQGPPVPPLRGVAGFASAFAKELRKDFGVGK